MTFVIVLLIVAVLSYFLSKYRLRTVTSGVAKAKIIAGSIFMVVVLPFTAACFVLGLVGLGIYLLFRFAFTGNWDTKE